MSTTVAADAAIPVTVLSGYLGAGKTTLVNHLLRHPGGRRIGVLVNDIGAVSIDAALISEVTDDVVTLANGCICCNLTDGFATALDRLRWRPLDAVVIECSGVADPTAVAAHVQTPGFELAGIVVVADAATIPDKVDDRYVGVTITRQLAAADLIVLNKADLADMAIAGRVIARYSNAPRVPTVHGRLAVEMVLGIDHVVAKSTSTTPLPTHPTDTLTWARPITSEEFERLLAGLPGDTVRAKGLFDLADEPDHQTIVQVVGARRVITRRQWPEPGVRSSALVIIRQPHR